MAGNLTLVRRGKPVSREEVAEAPIVVAGSGLPDGGTAYVFDTDDEFLGWAREVGKREMVDRLNEAATKGQEQETRADLASVEAWQKKRAQQITSNLNELAQFLGLPVNSPELLRKATVDPDPLIGTVLHSYILFEDRDCEGGFIPIVGLVPNLDWLNFSNRASSANGAGGATLFSRYYFRGKRTYLLNIGTCLNLADLAFDNIASSAITV